MKYIVKVQYYRFTFTDRIEAMDFAETAKISTNEGDIDVSIELEKEEE